MLEKKAIQNSVAEWSIQQRVEIAAGLGSRAATFSILNAAGQCLRKVMRGQWKAYNHSWAKEFLRVRSDQLQQSLRPAARSTEALSWLHEFSFFNGRYLILNDMLLRAIKYTYA
mmetsp:Transcript_56547/g.89807  ORF Transcript_56547/g.89807 Transcript_56547/m.89807 type:complete len:114 (-) Transcript_56547:11-352(-)